MLYKRIIYSSRTNPDLGKTEKKGSLPMLIIKGSEQSKTVIKKPPLILKIKNFPSGEVTINHHESYTFSSSIETPSYRFDRDASSSYKCNQLIYDDKKINEILFMKKKENSISSIRIKHPMKLKKRNHFVLN